jgi:cardiolipin synthase
MIPNGSTLQVIGSGPGFLNDIILQTLLTSIYIAKKSLTLTTPYFVPNDELLRAICIASYRGIEVNIILPSKNDSIMVGWASRAFFTELLEAGVNIYYYSAGLLHTKSVLVDKQLSLIGSVNLDMRSLWLNYEITTLIDDQHFAQQLNQLQQSYMASSTIIQPLQWRKRPFWHKILERLFYFFAPLL